jgi:hypothetical protein
VGAELVRKVLRIAAREPEALEESARALLVRQLDSDPPVVVRH